MHELWICRETEWSFLKFTEPPLNFADLPLHFVLHFLNLSLNVVLHFLNLQFNVTLQVLDLHLNFFLYSINLPLDLSLYFSLVRITSIPAQLPFSAPIRLVQPSFLPVLLTFSVPIRPKQPSSLPLHSSSLPSWQTAFKIVCPSIWSKVRSLAFTGKSKYPTSDAKCDKIDLWVYVNAVQ
ncbi:hypothetical protein AVEN_23342-1 [Araneus ventricosus]|uniref:Uncharacterized protein n=1 Tax=Araneus ventricosus TaxID=182803 RepID=A0A4Y2FV69_ARAVE|nr:hypothetical protein AVEN_23342-1 [Araneus ventricosus]